METLKFDDKVIFRVGNEVLHYQVKHNHLVYQDEDKYNHRVFTLLEMITQKERWEFASKIYGYQVVAGDWPCFRVDDYAAATELVKALHDLCNLHNIKLL
jgi:hypothetical protein